MTCRPAVSHDDDESEADGCDLHSSREEIAYCFGWASRLVVIVVCFGKKRVRARLAELIGPQFMPERFVTGHVIFAVAFGVAPPPSRHREASVCGHVVCPCATARLDLVLQLGARCRQRQGANGKSADTFPILVTLSIWAHHRRNELRASACDWVTMTCCLTSGR